MPDFAYTARNMQGKRVNGKLSAASQREAISLLAGESLFPIEVKLENAGTKFEIKRRVKGQHLAALYAQMAALLRSGVPLLRTMKVLIKQLSHKSLKEVIEDVHDRVEDGETLADAMERHRATFGELGVSMIRAGGEGGFLEDALERVAQFTEEQEDLKARTMGALAYPGFLAVVGTLVVAALVVFFVPSFAEMFEELRAQGELPSLTEWLLWLSDTIRTYWLLIVLAMGFAYAVLKMMLSSEDGKRSADAVKLKIPIAGNIYKNLAVARFCRVLGTLLKNGVPILRSLEISRGAAGNRVLSDAVEKASDNISSGERLATPLAQSGYFPVSVVEMISVAEESNTLDKVLVEVADGLEKRTSRQLDLAVRLLEPIMLLILATIVLLVVIALLVPVLKMSGTV